MLMMGIANSFAANGKSIEAKTSQEEVQVKAYYFHATRRCETCQAVEKVTKELIEEAYSEKVDMLVYNREKDENKALVEKYEISGQTLLLVKGDRVVNLTTKAFLSARNNPEKFKKELKAAIDEML
jgi:hypothetical protein